MSAISQLLLTRFCWNFIGSFLGASRTDFTIKLTFVQATFVLATFVHIRNISAVIDPQLIIIYKNLLNKCVLSNSMLAISQLLLARFWWNFKGSFLGASRTDSNYQVDICPGNICPGNICPYQEYLSCYWPDFDETLKVASWNHL